MIQKIKRNFKLDWLLLTLLIFIPRLLHLNLFLTADEPLFLAQAREFAAGLASGDFKQTLGIGYPGVTVAAWAAPVVNLAQTELGAYTAGRMAVAFLTGLLMLAMYGLACSLVGRGPALLALVLLALDPYTLAYSRLFHIEATLALLMTLAALSVLLWLDKGQGRWLVWAGLFTGLALLTKSTALLLGPMLGVMILGWGWSGGRQRSRKWWLAVIKGGLLIAVIASLIFWSLWPAMWVDPLAALALTFGKLLTDQEAGAGNLGLFWFGRFVEDPGPLFYPVAFILKSTPWLLAFMIYDFGFWILDLPRHCAQGRRFAFYGLHTTNDVPHTTRRFSLTLSLWLFSLTYLILMTLASKKSIRYLLPAFPSLYLLAGLTFYQFGKHINRPWSKSPISLSPHLPISPSSIPFGKLRASLYPLSSILHPPPFIPFDKLRASLYPLSSILHPPSSILYPLFSIPLLLFTSFYHPYYFTYYNPLLLGWRWAPQTILVGWGEGLDEAARYLNQQPAQQVAAWYDWLFPLFYTKGQVQPVTPQENLITAGRVVLYINQIQRDIPSPAIIHYFQTRRRPEYTVRLAGIDYAWVYPGPIAGFQAPPPPAYNLGGEFGGEARLLGYNLQPHPATGGEPLIVTLYWQILNRPAAPRFVYLRLVDAEGHIWAKTDGPPVMGLWPVERWQPGMVIEDAHELPIPAGTPPGRYRLEVGMYEPGSGQPLAASGQPVGPGGGLLLGEVEVEWRSLPQTELDLRYEVDVALSTTIHLIGYNPPPAAATTGDLIPLDLVWREAGSRGRLEGWNVQTFKRSNVQTFKRSNLQPVLFEWVQEGRSQAEQFDSLPLPTARWGQGAVLRSQHSLIVPPALATGVYDLQLRLSHGVEPAGLSFHLGSVVVTAPDHQFELPPTAIAPAGQTAQVDQKIGLAGYELDHEDRALKLTLYWQTQTPLTRSYKIFAQLLAAENKLMAQSDTIPAAGRRPTTGWLPAEIISDPHLLPLPDDLPVSGQDYHLIAGLYDPLTGRRLPVWSGDTMADSILVAEVKLP